MQLTPSQSRAIAHVARVAAGGPVDGDLRVTLNFHPDRMQILASMGRDGIYKSQFETGESNGALTAHPGGARWLWESRIFGNAYDNVQAHERPKYGALNFRRSPFGAAPRFGSAYVRLVPIVLGRSTFCYPDSVFEPTHFGTAQRMALIALAAADTRDALDDYVEAQVHGQLLFGRDVEAIVLDPSYANTEVAVQAAALGCPVEWHAGFALSITEMRKYPAYRGLEFVLLGEEIAENGILTPHVIGKAAASERYDLQDLKKVWHYVARFGRRCP